MIGERFLDEEALIDFNSVQLAQIRLIVTVTVNKTMQAVVTSAALATVEAMKNDVAGVQVNTQAQDNETICDLETPTIIQGMQTLSMQITRSMVTHCRTYPANYIKEIQSSEFYKLSK